jgi:hypothetical protein
MELKSILMDPHGEHDMSGLVRLDCHCIYHLAIQKAHHSPIMAWIACEGMPIRCTTNVQVDLVKGSLTSNVPHSYLIMGIEMSFWPGHILETARSEEAVDCYIKSY